VSTEPGAAFARASEAAGATVRGSTRESLCRVLGELLEGERVVVADAGLEAIADELRDHGIRVISEDRGTEFSEALPTADAGLSSALAGVAASGTVVIGPGSGYEGFVSLLPPHCIVVLPAELIYADLDTALSGLAPLVAAGSRITFVTGPSRTSDIELTPVVGVHGPLRLDVVIVDG
jgi:L-lactate utilization protein LutC